jgi:hypothetical protein
MSPPPTLGKPPADGRLLARANTAPDAQQQERKRDLASTGSNGFQQQLDPAG